MLDRVRSLYVNPAHILIRDGAEVQQVQAVRSVHLTAPIFSMHISTVEFKVDGTIQVWGWVTIGK
jgi:hypothetical protein